MFSLLNSMFRLPVTVMSAGASVLGPAARGMQKFAGESLSLLDRTLGGARGRDEPDRATEAARRDALDDDHVKLVEHTIVDLHRGHEEIVDSGYRIVAGRSREASLSAELIDEFLRQEKHAGRDREQLRVYVGVLEKWQR